MDAGGGSQQQPSSLTLFARTVLLLAVPALLLAVVETPAEVRGALVHHHLRSIFGRVQHDLRGPGGHDAGGNNTGVASQLLIDTPDYAAQALGFGLYAEPPLVDEQHCLALPHDAGPVALDPADGRTFVSAACGGGFGNQLFCYASAFAYALDHGRCLVLPEVIYHSSSARSTPYNASIFRHISFNPDAKAHWEVRENQIEQPGLLMAYKQPPAMPHRWFVGLVGGHTNYRYFLHRRAELRRYFAPSADTMLALLRKYPDLPNGVAVHFRRGDFLEWQHMFPIPENYYYEHAVHTLAERIADGSAPLPESMAREQQQQQQPPARRVAGQNGGGGGRGAGDSSSGVDTGSGALRREQLTFYIATNDYPWAKSQDFIRRFPGRLVWLEDDDEVATWYIMMLARRGIVCPNSTFCWWAAFLGLDARQVFMPSRWYEAPDQVPTDIYFPGVTVVYSGKPGTRTEQYGKDG